jgi:hypothetical protein
VAKALGLTVPLALQQNEPVFDYFVGGGEQASILGSSPGSSSKIASHFDFLGARKRCLARSAKRS